MDPPPPAYRPEWAPDYRPDASAPPPGPDTELQPIATGSSEKGYGGGYPSNEYSGAYPAPPVSDYSPGQPLMGGTYPQPPGQPPPRGVYLPPPGSVYPPPASAPGYPPPGGSVYPPPSGGYPGYPPPGGAAYPPTITIGAQPVTVGQVAVSADEVETNDADFSQTSVTLIDREDYQGPILIGPEQIDPKDAEAKSESCAGWCRWSFWHGSLYLWLGLLIWQLVERKKHSEWEKSLINEPGVFHPKEDHYNQKLFIASAVLMPLFYFFMLFETCCSQTDDYVTNKLNLEQAEEKIQKVRKALPKIVWEAKCYHSEVEYRNTSDGQSDKEEREVVSHREKYTFHFTEMIDVSPSFKMDNFRKGDFVRVEFQKSFGFLDEQTQSEYTREYEAFKERNKSRDKEVDFKESFEFDEKFDDFVTVYWGNDEPNWCNDEPNWCFVSQKFYWLCTLFMCGSFYKAWFKGKTKKTVYTFCKLMKK